LAGKHAQNRWLRSTVCTASWSTIIITTLPPPEHYEGRTVIELPWSRSDRVVSPFWLPLHELAMHGLPSIQLCCAGGPGTAPSVSALADGDDELERPRAGPSGAGSGLSMRRFGLSRPRLCGSRREVQGITRSVSLGFITARVSQVAAGDLQEIHAPSTAWTGVGGSLLFRLGGMLLWAGLYVYL
jgi:hypothetical protein